MASMMFCGQGTRSNGFRLLAPHNPGEHPKGTYLLGPIQRVTQAMILCLDFCPTASSAFLLATFGGLIRGKTRWEARPPRERSASPHLAAHVFGWPHRCSSGSFFLINGG